MLPWRSHQPCHMSCTRVTREESEVRGPIGPMISRDKGQIDIKGSYGVWILETLRLSVPIGGSDISLIRGRGRGSPEVRILRAVGPEIKALMKLGSWTLGGQKSKSRGHKWAVF